MKLELEFIRFALGPLVADENQKLLLKLEEIIMSQLTAPLNQALADLATAKTEADALKASNATLTADAVTKQAAIDAATAQITDLQAQLAAAGVDPADVTLVNQLAQGLADLKAALA